MANSVNRLRQQPSVIVVLIIVAALVMAITYSGLAVYKAFQYTNTPRQNVSSITPPDDGLTYEDVTFPSAAGDGVQLSGWWVPNPNSHRVLILVHGRYANRMQMLPLAKPLWEQGYSLLLFDLRGHGKSTNVESTYGVKEQWDVIAAAQFAQREGFAPESIGVIGWSLGGSSTLMAMGSSTDFAAAVTDSAYANSDPLLARNPLRPGLELAMKLFRGVDLAKVRPVDAIRGLGNRSIMLIHGADDTAVPLAQEKLLQAAGGDAVKQVWIVPGAGHVQAYSQHSSEYVQRVAGFFDAVLK